MHWILPSSRSNSFQWLFFVLMYVDEGIHPSWCGIRKRDLLLWIDDTSCPISLALINNNRDQEGTFVYLNMNPITVGRNRSHLIHFSVTESLEYT